MENFPPKSRVVSLNTRSEPVTIDTTSTAVIVVDMQNDFGAKGGMFDRAGIDISGIQKAIAPTSRVLDLARRCDIKIIYLKMGFRPDLSDLGSPESVNRVRHLRFGVGQTILAPDGSESRILIRDTWNTDILQELEPQKDDVVIYKHRFSGFYETDLDERLKQMGIKHLIVIGCTTSRDYSCILLTDCMSEPVGFDFPRSNHDASLLAIEMLFGWASTSDEFINALTDNLSNRTS